MKGFNHIHRDQQGSILLVVLGFLCITIGLVITILGVASNARRISQEQVDMEKAMYVAEGGLERGARFMQSNLNVIVSSSTGCTNGSGSIGSGSYTFSIIRSNGASSTYFIIATGTVSSARSGVGVTRVCKLLNVYQPTYAQFSLWSATNGAIWFVSGETFSGQVHSDDQMYFNASGGGPVFHSAVTSGAGTYTISGGAITDIEFDQGFALNTFLGKMADVDFNSAASTSLKNEASNTGTLGTLLVGTSTITFNSGTFTVTNTRKSWNNHVLTNSTTGDNIIYVQAASSGTLDTAGKVYLNGGTLQGRVTIASEDDINIGGNIFYKNDPQTIPSSTDALGLIAMSDVWVGSTAPNNLQIHAAIMATGVKAGVDGSFGVTGYDSGPSRGILTVYGGIVQEIRGAVGTGSGGASTTGYSKNYSYDSRFITKPPPYYPTISNQLSFAQWSESN
ncbi:MAG: hypothetical protein ABSH14_17080 [Verrucomicrobiia bacterium]|jgi:hypothetical protein